ncbi:MAG TPA: GTP cyclohydrolase I FolE [Candidatus Dormibacteraeota bacterium]|jgi:GTP cyclohydrolase I|nr:GTP cyclohydrolase I FolE [Candidatus Dormibacteraeota bacterium]
MSAAQPARALPVDELETLARQMLVALGEDPEREGLVDTPRRVAESLVDLTDGYGADPRQVVGSALYEHEGDDLVTVRNIPFYALCEHHLLPFFGRCHIGYLPVGKVIGLSKLPRLVDLFAHRLQLQERLTRQIAEAIDRVLLPRGVAVVMEARHMCLEMRGVEKADSDTVTSCLLGGFRENAALRAEFLDLVRS